jgi:hypothetical protein
MKPYEYADMGAGIIAATGFISASWALPLAFAGLGLGLSYMLKQRINHKLESKEQKGLSIIQSINKLSAKIDEDHGSSKLAEGPFRYQLFNKGREVKPSEVVKDATISSSMFK